MLNLGLPENPKVLILTALNSIKDSLAENMMCLGLDASVLTIGNAKQVLESQTVKIVFVSPEVLKQSSTVQALLAVRNTFVLKCIGQGSRIFHCQAQSKSKLNGVGLN